MVRKRRFAWRHIKKTVPELLRADLGAHALAHTSENGPLRRTTLSSGISERWTTCLCLAIISPIGIVKNFPRVSDRYSSRMRRLMKDILTTKHRRARSL